MFDNFESVDRACLNALDVRTIKERFAAKSAANGRVVAMTLALLAMLGTASSYAAEMNLKAPFNPGERWIATTYAGHSGVGTNGAIDFNRDSGPENEVRAAHRGVLKRMPWSATYGNWVEITGDNGLKTRYAHLRAFGPASGTRVEAGDTIGLCGSTGQSTGSHLHVEIFLNGVRQDVRNYSFDDQPLKFNQGIISLYNTLEEGHLYRAYFKPEVFYVIAGSRWWVSDEAEVAAFGGWNSVRKTRIDTIESKPIAKPLPGIMYRLRSFPEVFVDHYAYPGERTWVQSLYWVNYYGGWGAIRVVPNGSFTYPQPAKQI